MRLPNLVKDLKYRILARVPLRIQDQINLRSRKVRYRELAAREPDTLIIEAGNDRRIAHSTWFRGETVNYLPTRINLREKNAIRDYVLKGWLPERPFITRNDYVTAFGSCFAAHITAFLSNRGYNVFGKDLSRESYVIRCGEGMVNTFAIAQQFQWAYGEKEFSESLWFDKAGVEAKYSEEVRERTRDIFEATDVFVMTLGLSEVWHDKVTGDVYWRAIPRSKYDPSRHGFKVSTVAENLDNLNTIYRIIRERRPNASIIFTLSPIPLVATFRPVSCITANSVSKSILRVAIDELYRAHSDDKKLLYFPSYEIVKEYYNNAYQSDNRHVKMAVVDKIMNIFAENYLVEDAGKVGG